MIKAARIFIISFVFLAGILFTGSFALAAPVIYDFEVVNITTSPAEPILNAPCDITVTVKSINPEDIIDNDGVDDYTHNFVDFEYSAVVLPDISPEHPVKQGETFTYVFKGVFNNKGEKSLDFFVNKNQSWPETRMSNNDKRVKVIVISGYDLTVSSIEVKPSNPAPGQSIKALVTIKNNSQLDLITTIGIKSFQVDFDNFDFRKSTIPEISLNNSLTVGSTTIIIVEGVFMSAGQKNLRFVIDNDDALYEFNETNNEFSRKLEVIPINQLDVAVDSIEIKDEGEGVLKGSDMEVLVTIKNTGNVSITSGDGLGMQNHLFNFDDFSKISIADYPTPTVDDPFDPGETLSSVIKGKFNTPGNKKVTYTIDNYNKLKETSETNNYLEDTLYIYSTQAEIDQFELLSVGYDLISSTSAMIKWSASKKIKGEIIYRRESENRFDIQRIFPRIENWPITDTMLKSDSKEIVNIKQGDSIIFQVRGIRNSAERFSNSYSFKTPINDTVKLEGVISEKASTTPGAIAIIWNTNLMSSGHVYYKKTGEENYKKTGSDVLTASHNISIEKLDTGNYEYYVESKMQGNVYKSENKSFSFNTASVKEETTPVPENNPVETNILTESINIQIKNKDMYSRLKGKIILKVEDSGKAYYVNPVIEAMHYLGRPADAFSVMREQGIGITNINLEKIPIGLKDLSGSDADGDGLSDIFEDAIGTNKNNIDSDGDGYNDKQEIIDGYSPKLKAEKMKVDINFANNQKGKIFLQIEGRGEAWYVNPGDGKRYFLGRPTDAFGVMRNFGLGISNNDFNAMQ